MVQCHERSHCQTVSLRICPAVRAWRAAVLHHDSVLQPADLVEGIRSHQMGADSLFWHCAECCHAERVHGHCCVSVAQLACVPADQGSTILASHAVCARAYINMRAAGILGSRAPQRADHTCATSKTWAPGWPLRSETTSSLATAHSTPLARSPPPPPLRRAPRNPMPAQWWP